MAKQSMLIRLRNWFTDWSEDKTRAVLNVTLAVLTGLLLGLVLDTVFRQIGNYIFPPPPTFDMASPEDIRTLLDTVPADAYIIKLVSWTLGTFGGGYIAVRMARTGAFPAWLTGILLVASYMIHMSIIPHPNWVVMICLPLCAVSAYGAGLLGNYVTLMRLRQTA
ncbi:hypothetical protein PQU92_09345 [Asticcacaulis sp. BYS171W]|uniref:Uncharacterized protein n=1 Tax=Asticcacaulis aquaticus TaxID=2984212 RepID=A0ABT5HTV7_9CAUL|nr:hypothetical protein [Asticcacaulis aquaticus]MDC7683479.1 hypothetical protein [Asticcacaulis aquaticus]